MSGTSAGRHGCTRKPNCCATWYPNGVAPIFGIDKPPVAMTKDRAEKTPRSVSRRKPSSWTTSRTRVLNRIVTASRGTLLLQHGNNIARCPVAKELPQRLLVPWDLVLLYQLQKISRSVAGKRGLGEMWIGGEEISRSRVQIGEVAAPAAGDQDLLADPVGMVKQKNPASAAARMDGAEKTCGAGAHDDHIVGAIRQRQLFIR